MIVLIACGIFNLAMAAFHLWAMKGLHIGRDLKYAMPLTRSFCHMLNVALTFWLAYSGLMCIVFREELSSTTLGAFWLSGWAVFWWGRTIAHWWLFGAKSKHFMIWMLVLSLGSVLYTASAGRGLFKIVEF